MPKPKNPSAPSPRPEPRILDPGTAKRLSRGESIPPTKPQRKKGLSIPRSSSRPPLDPTINSVGPSLARRRFLPPFITNLRNRYSLPPFTHLRKRYSCLPGPVRHTARTVFRTLRILGILLPIALFVNQHELQTMWVGGPSMTPYINENWDEMHTKKDWLLVRIWRQGLVWPWESEITQPRLERGMVVSFRSPSNPHQMSVKRIVGLPGDRITTREPSLKPTQIVPYNHVWLEGDAEDPRNSLDSNTYGPVSLSLLRGQVIAVLLPRFRWLKWTDWEAGTPDDGSLKDAPRSGYRQGVRDRVVKDAVRLEKPLLF